MVGGHQEEEVTMMLHAGMGGDVTPVMVAQVGVGIIAALLSYPADLLVQYVCGHHSGLLSQESLLAVGASLMQQPALRSGEAPSPEHQASLDRQDAVSQSGVKSDTCSEKAGIPVGAALLGGGLLLGGKNQWVSYALMAMGASVLFVASRPYSGFGKPMGSM